MCYQVGPSKIQKPKSHIGYGSWVAIERRGRETRPRLFATACSIACFVNKPRCGNGL